MKTESLKVRLSPKEKTIFEQAAEMEGLDVSVMIRLAARKESIRIFSDAGRPNPFHDTPKSGTRKTS